MTGPYYQDDYVTLYHGDAFDVLPNLDKVDHVITDPPYNIGKAGWDKIDDYEEWCSSWIAASSKLLEPPGGFWIFHSEPLVLAELTRVVERHDRRMVSWVTLDKSSWGVAKRYKNAGSKSFPASVEYATYCRREVYAKQIREIREDAGMTRAEFDIIVSPSKKPTGITYRWEHGERVPQEQEIEVIEQRFGVRLMVPQFNNPAKHQAVWQFPQTDTTDHPTPKPLNIMERIVQTTTDPGDIILDPFAGSGTTLLAAKNLGRRTVGVEMSERYCEVIAKRCQQEVLDIFWSAA